MGAALGLPELMPSLRGAFAASRLAPLAPLHRSGDTSALFDAALAGMEGASSAGGTAFSRPRSRAASASAPSSGAVTPMWPPPPPPPHGRPAAHALPAALAPMAVAYASLLD